MTRLFPSKPDEAEKPIFVVGDDIAKYSATDLSYTYCHLKCAEIGAVKMIDISTATIRSWYLEFIRLGWNVAMFQSRCEAIKRQKIYGAIDLHLWIEAQMTYSQYELNLAVNERIESMLNKGATYQRLAERGFELTDEEVKLAHLEAANQCKNKFIAKRRELVETLKAELVKAKYDEVSLKKGILAGFDSGERLEFALVLVANEIIADSEAPICAKYLPDFADLIPQDLINSFTQEQKIQKGK